VEKGLGRWRDLKLVKADKELVTAATVQLCESKGGGGSYQADCAWRTPPRDRGGRAEGAIRWMQNPGQANMNRAMESCEMVKLGALMRRM
jgi:hypothetical protein